MRTLTSPLYCLLRVTREQSRSQLARYQHVSNHYNGVVGREDVNMLDMPLHMLLYHVQAPSGTEQHQGKAFAHPGLYLQYGGRWHQAEIASICNCPTDKAVA